MSTAKKKSLELPGTASPKTGSLRKKSKSFTGSHIGLQNKNNSALGGGSKKDIGSSAKNSPRQQRKYENEMASDSKTTEDDKSSELDESPQRLRKERGPFSPIPLPEYYKGAHNSFDIDSESDRAAASGYLERMRNTGGRSFRDSDFGQRGDEADPDFDNMPTKRDQLHSKNNPPAPFTNPHRQNITGNNPSNASSMVDGKPSPLDLEPLRKRISPKLHPTKLFIDRNGSKDLKAKVMKQASGFGYGLVRSMYHYCITGEFLKMLYIQDQLTDVAIFIGNSHFNVHRVVLACHSEYFENVFLKKNEGGTVVPSEIELSNISEDAFQSILEFMYTGETNISLANVVEILSASRHLKIYELQRQCEDLVSNVIPENALIILDIAQRYSLQTILEKAYRCITEYFYEVVSSDSFLKLELARVIALLSDDNVQIASEMDIFRAGIRWIGYDRENRINTSERLMTCVRFPLMTQEELIACVDEATDVMQKEGCIQMLYYANWYHTCIRLGKNARYDLKGPAPRNKPYSHSIMGGPSAGDGDGAHGESAENPEWNKAFETRVVTPETTQAFSLDASSHHRGLLASASHGQGPETKRPSKKDSKTYLATGVHPLTQRSPSPLAVSADRLNLTSPTILIVGGFNMQKGDKKVPMRAVDIYLPKPNCWERLTKLPERRTHHAAAFFQSALFITGGFNGRNVTDTAFRYDIKENKWQTMTSMLSKRMCHQLCVLGEHLYAVGGQDDNQQLLNSVERYSGSTGQWEFVASMSAGKLGTSVCTHKGLLWVVGGYDDNSNVAEQNQGAAMPVLRSVESYDPQANAWNVMNPLRFPRCMANLVEANGKIYILGGATKCQSSPQPTVVSIAAVDVYDDESDEWYEVSQLETPRYNSGCTVIGHRIFIAGGMNSMDNQSLSSVECYDVKKDMWLKGVKDIPKVALGLSCVSLPPLKDL